MYCDVTCDNVGMYMGTYVHICDNHKFQIVSTRIVNYRMYVSVRQICTQHEV